MAQVVCKTAGFAGVGSIPTRYTIREAPRFDAPVLQGRREEEAVRLLVTREGLASVPGFPYRTLAFWEGACPTRRSGGFDPHESDWSRKGQSRPGTPAATSWGTRPGTRGYTREGDVDGGRLPHLAHGEASSGYRLLGWRLVRDQEAKANSRFDSCYPDCA